MLELLEAMDEPGFIGATFVSGTSSIRDGQVVHQMGYWSYHRVIDSMWELLYTSSAKIDAYGQLPEDEPQEVGFDIFRIEQTNEFFMTASLDQVRRFLTLCTRGERFCDGHIAGMLESGMIKAALMRLRELHRTLERLHP